MIKSGSKTIYSFDLLQNIINLLSFFKMKYEARKTIQFIIEEFLKSNEFLSEDTGKIDYPLSEEGL
jgi:hypothetical protein